MSKKNNLQRFIDAQQNVYEVALKEIQNGRKKSHWMWFVFPQVKGLGYSEASRHYGISNLEEANEYLQDPLLGKRLIEISNALLQLQKNDARDVFGYPDDLKLKSSMTLFAAVENTDPVFELVLEKFFEGRKDEKTLHLIGNQLK